MLDKRSNNLYIAWRLFTGYLTNGRWIQVETHARCRDSMIGQRLSKERKGTSFMN